MNKIYLLLAFVLVCHFLHAQCPAGNVTLTTQNQVNNFKVAYPNCTNFNFSVSISGAGINNLSGLSNLSKAKSISISNTSLTSLSGLNSLTEVDGLFLSGNQLTSLNGLNALTIIHGSLQIFLEYTLTDISALSNLTKLDELGLFNTAIPNLNALQNIDSLSSLGMQACEYLSDISALKDVKFKSTITSSLVLVGNPVLTDCVGSMICTAASTLSDPFVVMVGSNGDGCGSLTQLQANCLAALPVTLVNFDARKTDSKSVFVTWATTSETNSGRFEIHRSNDGKAWNSIGTVTAQGESSNTIQYTFEDKTPGDGNNFYRLKMEDLDKSYTYSKIAAVHFENKKATGIYPNPVGDRVYLAEEDLKTLEQIRIMNAAGQVVYTSTRSHGDGYDLKGYPSGVYIIDIQKKNGKAISYKIFKN